LEELSLSVRVLSMLEINYETASDGV
jgi:hypothetical protein